MGAKGKEKSVKGGDRVRVKEIDARKRTERIRHLLSRFPPIRP